jgi:hypothetical protein
MSVNKLLEVRTRSHIKQNSTATRHGGAWGRGGIAPTHS